MKKIVLLLLLGMVLIVSIALAEQGPPVDFDKLNRDAEKRFHVRKDSDTGIVVFSRGRTRPYPGKPREAAENFLREYHRMFKLSAGLHEIKFDKQGGTREHPAFHYNQYYKGIPVLAGGISITMDSRNQIITARDYIKEISDLSTEPVIQPDELEELLGRNVPAYGPIAVGPELIVYTIGKEPVLAYELVAYETGTDEGFRLFVDATTGEILLAAKTQCYFSGPDTQQPSETADKKTHPVKRHEYSGIIKPKFGVKRNPNATPIEVVNPPGWGKSETREHALPEKTTRILTGEEAEKIRRKYRKERTHPKPAAELTAPSNKSKPGLTVVKTKLNAVKTGDMPKQTGKPGLTVVKTKLNAVKTGDMPKQTGKPGLTVVNTKLNVMSTGDMPPATERPAVEIGRPYYGE